MRKTTETTTLTSRLAAALRRTWQAVGADALASLPNGIADRDEVIEMAADFIEIHGGLSADDRKAWRAMSFADQQAIGETAFPGSRYGY